MTTETITLEEFNNLEIDDKKNICFSWYKLFKSYSDENSESAFKLTRKLWEEFKKTTENSLSVNYIPTASKIVDIFSEPEKQNGWSIFISEAETVVFNNPIKARTRKTQVSYETLSPARKEKIDDNVKKFYSIIKHWFDYCSEKVGDTPTYKQWNKVSYEHNMSEETISMRDIAEKMPNAGQVTQLFYRWSIFIELFSEPDISTQVAVLRKEVDDIFAPIKDKLSEIKKSSPVSVDNLLNNPMELEYFLQRMRSHSIILDIRTTFFNDQKKTRQATEFKEEIETLPLDELEKYFETAEKLYENNNGDLVIRAGLRAVLKNITFIFSLREAFSIIEN